MENYQNATFYTHGNKKNPCFCRMDKKKEINGLFGKLH